MSADSSDPSFGQKLAISQHVLRWAPCALCYPAFSWQLIPFCCFNCCFLFGSHVFCPFPFIFSCQFCFALFRCQIHIKVALHVGVRFHFNAGSHVFCLFYATWTLSFFTCQLWFPLFKCEIHIPKWHCLMEINFILMQDRNHLDKQERMEMVVYT